MLLFIFSFLHPSTLPLAVSCNVHVPLYFPPPPATYLILVLPRWLWRVGMTVGRSTWLYNLFLTFMVGAPFPWEIQVHVTSPFFCPYYYCLHVCYYSSFSGSHSCLEIFMHSPCGFVWGNMFENKSKRQNGTEGIILYTLAIVMWSFDNQEYLHEGVWFTSELLKFYDFMESTVLMFQCPLVVWPVSFLVHPILISCAYFTKFLLFFSSLPNARYIPGGWSPTVAASLWSISYFLLYSSYWNHSWHGNYTALQIKPNLLK